MIITHTMEMCWRTTLRSVFFTTLSLQLTLWMGWVWGGKEGGSLQTGRGLMYCMQYDMTLFCCVQAITAPYMDGFSNYWVQMFSLARQCSMHAQDLDSYLKVKVVIWGQRLKGYCPGHIFYSTSARITKHGVRIHLRMAKCCILFKGLCDLNLDLWP